MSEREDRINRSSDRLCEEGRVDCPSTVVASPSGTSGIDDRRRTLLSRLGAIVGALSIGSTSVATGHGGGGPLLPGTPGWTNDAEDADERPPPIGERRGGDGNDDQRCSGGDDDQSDDDQSGDDTDPFPEEPDARYRALLAEQIRLRDENDPAIDRSEVRTVLRSHNESIYGNLVFFAASDFGRPLVFFPRSMNDPESACQSVLDRIHEEKWLPTNRSLRAVREDVVEGGLGVHQGLAAICYDDRTAEYDIVSGSNGVYNFVTIRQVVGLVDWVTNADDRWLQDHRLEY